MSASSLAVVPEKPGGVERWIRQVNDRWLVHSNLNVDARDYLDRLAACSPERLARTCGIVKRLMSAHDPLEDPKPPFYGGLFSLSTMEEQNHFLASHRFTRLLLPTTSEETLEEEAEYLELSPEVRQRLEMIRRQIRQELASFHGGQRD